MTSDVEGPIERRAGGLADRRRRIPRPGPWRQPRLDAATMLARQRRVFGGVKLGAAFFGWVTAVGMTVLLTLGVLAVMIGVSILLDTDAAAATDNAASNTAAVSILGAILLAAIVFSAFLCGGYVAARMARFDGRRQGLAVFGWTLAIPAVLLASAIAVDLGFRDVGQSLLPGGGTAALLVGALGIAALGAVLGGLLGERFHRRVDGVGLTGSVE